jgi:hypothetical protein
MTRHKSRLLNNDNSRIFEQDDEGKIGIGLERVAGVSAAHLDDVSILDEIAFANLAIIHADAALRNKFPRRPPRGRKPESNEMYIEAFRQRNLTWENQDPLSFPRARIAPNLRSV